MIYLAFYYEQFDLLAQIPKLPDIDPLVQKKMQLISEVVSSLDEVNLQ